MARRAVWLIMLAPPAFVFVMGYSEALLVLLAVAFFVNIRRGNWWWAGLFGYLAGTARPVGCLLAVPAVIEVIRSWRTDGWGRWTGKVVAIVSSVAGTVTYLGWVSAQFGEDSSSHSRSNSNRHITGHSPIPPRPSTTRSPTWPTGITSVTGCTSRGSRSPSC